MPIPSSITKDGFVSYTQLRSKIKLRNGQPLKPILIGTDGLSDSGKTRFLLTVPGMKQMVAVDRNFQSVFDSPGLEGTFHEDLAIKVIPVPQSVGNTKQVSAAQMGIYVDYYIQVREAFYSALAHPDSSVVEMDGDSDYWELHILSHFGKTTQIYPQTRYSAPYAEKRAQIARARDSGKIVIFTNKVKPQYETVYKADGTPEKDSVTGDDVRRKTGKMERQGFKDQDYLFDLQLRHFHTPKHTRTIGKREVEVPGQWGIEIMKCKTNMELVGTQLTGDDCNFKGLVQLAYPNVPLERWGF